MVDATKQIAQCLHSNCCSNRSKRTVFENFGNCAQFKNGQTMYYNRNNSWIFNTVHFKHETSHKKLSSKVLYVIEAIRLFEPLIQRLLYDLGYILFYGFKTHELQIIKQQPE